MIPASTPSPCFDIGPGPSTLRSDVPSARTAARMELRTAVIAGLIATASLAFHGWYTAQSPLLVPSPTEQLAPSPTPPALVDPSQHCAAP